MLGEFHGTLPAYKPFVRQVQVRIPNRIRCKDMSEFYDKAGLFSENEMEDDPGTQVFVPRPKSIEYTTTPRRLALRSAAAKSQLIKMEVDLMDDEVFHELVGKSEEHRQKDKYKQQEENVMYIRREAENELKLLFLALERIYMKTKSQVGLVATEFQRADIDDDYDADYYRKATGVQPEKDLFIETHSKKRKGDEIPRVFKKIRLDNKLTEKYNKIQDGHDCYREAIDTEPQKDVFREKPSRKRKCNYGDDEPRVFKVIRLQNWSYTSVLQNTDGSRQFNENQDDGKCQDGKIKFRKEGNRRINRDKPFSKMKVFGGKFNKADRFNKTGKIWKSWKGIKRESKGRERSRK